MPIDKQSQGGLPGGQRSSRMLPLALAVALSVGASAMVILDEKPAYAAPKKSVAKPAPAPSTSASVESPVLPVPVAVPPVVVPPVAVPPVVVPPVVVPPGVPTPAVPTEVAVPPGGCNTGISVLDQACTRLKEGEKAREEKEKRDRETAKMAREREIAKGVSAVVEDVNADAGGKDREDRVIVAAVVGGTVSKSDDAVVFGGDLSVVVSPDLKQKGAKPVVGFRYRRGLGTVHGKAYDGSDTELDHTTDRYAVTAGVSGTIARDVAAQGVVYIGADFAEVKRQDAKKSEAEKSVSASGTKTWPVVGVSTTWAYHPAGGPLGIGAELDVYAQMRRPLPGEERPRMLTFGVAGGVVILAAF